MSFETELAELINKHSRENVSGTPDFILAQYIEGCLTTFELATNSRDSWYGFKSYSVKSDGELSTPIENTGHAPEKGRCSCHERDSSYVCDYCFSQGFRGHMQKGM